MSPGLKRAALWLVIGVLIGGFMGAIFGGYAADLRGDIARYRMEKRLRAEPTNAHVYARANVELGDKTDKRLIIFGDSRAKGWSPVPRSSGLEALNRGIDGDTTAQMRLRLESDVIAIAPDLVLILGGINDAIAAAGSGERRAARIVAAAGTNLNAICARLETQGIEFQFFDIVPPLAPDAGDLALWGARVEPFAKAINKLVTAPGLPCAEHVLEIADLFIDTDGAPIAAHRRDALHWTPAAYRMLNARLP
ncbi:MAG: GDSL-type esterase/lipase family protein [Pseudomonadota bacterium]